MEYKRQFQRVARQPGDYPSVFAIELETLARRAFMDVDLEIQLQMVRDRFIDGQADRSLPRHLDSLEPNTPIIEMVDSCRIWERHCEPEIRPRMGTDRGPVHMTGQVSEDGSMPAIPSEMEFVEDTIRGLLPTPAPPPLEAAPKYTDRDILVRQLMETICPEDRPIPAIPSEMESVEDTIRRLLPTPAPPPLQAAPKYTDRDILVQQLMETICHRNYLQRTTWKTPSFYRFPVGTVTEEDSTEGCFSCGEWTHNTEQCQALDESFPLLLIGWVAERNENMFSLGPGPPSSPQSHHDWSGERGWSPGSAMPTDPNSQ